jgi:hypothetical protein
LYLLFVQLTVQFKDTVNNTFCQEELLALDLSLVKDGNEEKGHQAYEPAEIDGMGKVNALKKGGNLRK